jgi:Xaa-Pro aminopeptidase
MISAQAHAEHRDRLCLEARTRGLDGVLVYSWRRHAVTWLTGYSPGFSTNYAALWIPVDGRPRLAVRFPFDRARAQMVSGLDVIAGEPISLLPQSARKIGIVTGDFAINECPPQLRAELDSRGGEIVDLTSTVDDLRATKHREEVQALTRATQVAFDALSSVGAIAPLGSTDFDLSARIEADARRQGVHRVVCLVGIGDGAINTEPTGATVRAGDPVTFEVTLHAWGVCTQVNTTLLPSPASHHQTAALEACGNARNVILGALAPGATVRAAVAAGERALESFGLLDALEYDFGHGIGADTPEHPRLVRGSDRLLEVGMVLAVHVGLRAAGGSTAFVGAPVAIDEAGARELVA